MTTATKAETIKEIRNDVRRLFMAITNRAFFSTKDLKKCLGIHMDMRYKKNWKEVRTMLAGVVNSKKNSQMALAEFIAAA